MKTIAILLSLMFALQSCSLTQYKSEDVLEPPVWSDTDDLYKTYDANALEDFIPEEDELEQVIEVNDNSDEYKDINWMEEIGMPLAVGIAVGLAISLLCWLDAEAAKDSAEYQSRDPTINPYSSTPPRYEYRGCFVFDF